MHASVQLHIINTKYQQRSIDKNLWTSYTIFLYLEEIRSNNFNAVYWIIINPIGELEHPAQFSDQNKPWPENMRVSPKVSVLGKDKSGPRNRRAKPCLSLGGDHSFPALGNVRVRRFRERLTTLFTHVKFTNTLVYISTPCVSLVSYVREVY